MKLTKIDALIIAYAIIAVIVFGVAYNKDYKHTRDTCQLCSEYDETFTNSTRAILDAAIWPLYLSSIAFEFMKKEKE